MKAYKVTETEKSHYQGCGYALGVVVLGELTEFRYLRDIDEEWVCETDNAAIHLHNTGALDAHIKELALTGQVYLGMLSCWEFIALRRVAA